MAELDDRWRTLAAAARRAEPADAPPSAREIEELAALAVLAGRRTLVGPRPRRLGERASLAAAVLIVLAAVAALLPDVRAWRRFRASARAELAALPMHVPRAPRVPAAASALAILPDLDGVLPAGRISEEMLWLRIR
jgi:hypothetical protein